MLYRGFICCWCLFPIVYQEWYIKISYLLLIPEQQQPAPAIDGVFGKDWCMDLWREDKVPSQRKGTMELAAMTSMGAQVSKSCNS